MLYLTTAFALAAFCVLVYSFIVSRKNNDIQPLNVRFTIQTGVRLYKVPEKQIYKHKKNQFVYVTKDMVLTLVRKTKNYYYFKVHMRFVEKEYEAPHGSIVYISKTKYKDTPKRYV